MRKKIFISFVLVIFAFSQLVAKQIPIDLAKNVAINFVYEQTGNILKTSEIEQFKASNELPSNYFVFAIKPQGFVIVSADDVYLPIIAYSFDNDFKANNQHTNVLWWMSFYDNQINYLRETKTTIKAENKWQYYTQPIEKIENKSNKGTLTTVELNTPLWNQNAGWNELCPADPNGPGGHVYAGCVATAMSIIMKYWNYPLVGNGTSSYYHFTYGTLSVNHGATNYMFEHMPTNAPNYYNALLMYHCGVSVNMNYAPDGSGAYSTDVPSALKNKFYFANATYATKSSYTDAAWKTLLKGQLDNSRPIYYSGHGDDGGHAFVVDGYRTDDDYFHFNFGWSGYNNGWYAYTDAGGFYSSQACIYNIYPTQSYYPYYESPASTIAYSDSTQFVDFKQIVEWTAPQNSTPSGYRLLINDQLLEDNLSATTTSYEAMPAQVSNNYYTVRALYPNSKISLGLSAFAKGIFNVKFKIKKANGQSAKNVDVTFDNRTIKTNIAGESLFTDVLWAGPKPYTVYTDTITKTGNLNVYKDLTVTIYLKDSTPSGLNTSTINFVAYPNPATQYIYFQGLTNNNNVKIYDINARLVIDVSNVQNNIPFDVTMLKAGVYIIEIETSEYKHKDRLIIK